MGNVITTTVTGLAEDTSYEFKIIARSSGLGSYYDSKETYATQSSRSSAPDAATGFSASLEYTNSLVINWIESVSALTTATTQNIELTSASVFVPISEIDFDGTSRTYVDLSPVTDYNFKLTTINNLGSTP